MKNLKVFYLLPALALLSCSDEPLTVLEENTSTVNSIASFENAEVAYPSETGTVSQVFYAGKNIPVENLNGDRIYQEDILFDPAMVSSQPVKLYMKKVKFLPIRA